MLFSWVTGDRKRSVPQASSLTVPRDSPSFNIRMTSDNIKIPTHTLRNANAGQSPRIFFFHMQLATLKSTSFQGKTTEFGLSPYDIPGFPWFIELWCSDLGTPSVSKPAIIRQKILLSLKIL